MSSVTASSAAGIYGATPATICEVFTLNESAYWRPAATAPPPCHRPWRNIRQGGVFCNGNLHFLDDSGGITVFNVQDETFGTLGPPGPPSSSRRWGAVCAFTASFDGLVIVTANAMPSTCGCSRSTPLQSGRSSATLAAVTTRRAAPQHQLMLNSSSWIGPLDMYYDRWSAAEDCVGHEYILATCSSLTLAMAQPSLRSRWPSRAPAHHDLTWVSSRKALHEWAPRARTRRRGCGLRRRSSRGSPHLQMMRGA